MASVCAALVLGCAPRAHGAVVPPAPRFTTFPLPDTGQVRYLSDGGLEWVGEVLTPSAISLFGGVSEVALQRWNPATGATHTRDLGIEGVVGRYQVPFDDGTMFLLQQHNSIHPDWSAAWLTQQGVITRPMLAPGDAHTVQLVALPKASVFILERTPGTRHITGQWLRRQGQQLTLTAMPELPQAYNGDFAAVALDDHRVMILGGSDGKYRGCMIASSCRATTWILDLHDKQWSQGPNLLAPRTEAAAFRLPDGSVIVAGGWTPKDNWGPGPTRTAELWNPQSNAFEALPPMPVSTARAVAHWLPGYAGRVLIFAEGTSANLPAFDVASHTWFDAGAFGMGSQEGACAFFPFRSQGGFYAWQRYRSQGFYSSKRCESDNAVLGTLRFPRDVVPLPAPDPDATEVAIGRVIGSAGFVPPAVKAPALLIGGETGNGLVGTPFVASVDAVTPRGQIFALPPLHHPRAHPSVFRLGDGVLVLGGTAKSAYRRETPKLPAEWLSSIHVGLKAQWQDLDNLDFTPDTIVGQASDGSLLALGDHGTLDRITVDVQQGVPHFQRSVWLHLDRPRSGYGYDAGGGFKLAYQVHALELADGRIIVAGGSVQHDKIAVLTDTTGHAGQPDAYVSAGGFVSTSRFETWSPVTRQWTRSPPSSIDEGHWIPLADGRIIEVDDSRVNDGHLRIETFDPGTGHWMRGAEPAAMMLGAEWFTTQGQLLYAGAVRTEPYGSPGMRALQIFHPDTGQWTWLWKDTQGRFHGQYTESLLIQHADHGQTFLIPADGL